MDPTIDDKSVKTGMIMIHRQSALRMEGNGDEFKDGKDVSPTIVYIFPERTWFTWSYWMSDTKEEDG